MLADNPIGYWRFNEPIGSTNAIDSSSNNLDGNYSTARLSLEEEGVCNGNRGEGVLFNFDYEGIDDDSNDGKGLVSVPNDTLLNPANITMEALVSWSGPNGQQQRILEKSTSPSGTLAEYGLNILGDGKVQVELDTGGGINFFILCNQSRIISP